uniref:Uncharacterized protein n=1 Tax=Eutreptiella gymnastica TaxID=73025 RepID=A0A7S4GMH0_9EUGL
MHSMTNVRKGHHNLLPHGLVLCSQGNTAADCLCRALCSPPCAAQGSAPCAALLCSLPLHSSYVTPLGLALRPPPASVTPLVPLGTPFSQRPILQSPALLLPSRASIPDTVLFEGLPPHRPQMLHIDCTDCTSDRVCTEGD